MYPWNSRKPNREAERFEMAECVDGGGIERHHSLSVLSCQRVGDKEKRGGGKNEWI